MVWGGEFGRTVYCQGALTRDNYGRDHHPKCFPVWFAGGGIKKGVVHGETDDFCYNVVENPVHIHDLNATILHCLGIDHRRLTLQVPGPGHAAHGRRGAQPGQGDPGVSRTGEYQAANASTLSRHGSLAGAPGDLAGRA